MNVFIRDFNLGFGFNNRFRFLTTADGDLWWRQDQVIVELLLPTLGPSLLGSPFGLGLGVRLGLLFRLNFRLSLDGVDGRDFDRSFLRVNFEAGISKSTATSEVVRAHDLRLLNPEKTQRLCAQDQT